MFGLGGMPLWLLLLILLPRVGFSILGFVNPARFLRPDSWDYVQQGANLWKFGVFSNSPSAPYIPETFRVPGYPLFVGFWNTVLGLPMGWTIAIHCLVGAMTLGLMSTWLNDISNPKRAALVIAVMALEPVLLFHTPLLLTETLFVFLVAAAARATWRTLHSTQALPWGVCGFLWSLASMVRPVSLYLPILFSTAFIRSKKILLVFLISAYFLPLLWCARNERVGGSFSFSTQAGFDLLRYPASAVVSMDTKCTLQQASDQLKASVDGNHAPYSSAFEQSRLYGKRAVQVLTAHPFLFARFCVYGAARILFGSALEMFFEITGLPSNVPNLGYHAAVVGESTLALLSFHPWLYPLYFLYMGALAALYIAFGMGVWELVRTNKTSEGLFLLIGVLYFLGIASPLGHYRFRIPMMPFLIVGAVFARPKS